MKAAALLALLLLAGCHRPSNDQPEIAELPAYSDMGAAADAGRTK
jgi:uncharacterized lipoprotein YajG